MVFMIRCRCIPFGRRPGFLIPKSQVPEDLFDDLLILYHTNYFHLFRTLGAREWVYLVNLLDKTSPISLVLLEGFLRLKYGGYEFIESNKKQVRLITGF
jgi:hypothetical protein